MSPRRVTMHDVARRAGVSQPTVSLVLAGNPRARISQATRDRVLSAARALRYRPNVVARALAQRRSFAIAVIVPDLANPFFADVVGGVQRVAVQAGYAVFLCEAREVSVERHLEALRARQIDGVIIESVEAAALDGDALAGLDVSLIDEPMERGGVASDALGAGAAAARHLLDLGHRRLAFVGPAVDVHTFRMRERGFVQTLREAGLDLPADRLRRVPPTVAGGRDAMRELLAIPEPPTAVFGANDLLAIGALEAARAAGVAVPDQVSVMGCDGIEIGALVSPPLTTVTVPAREVGARAARELTRRLAGEAPPKKPGRLLPVRLTVRDSTGPAPGAA